MMTASLARTVRPLRISCLALAAGLALAACEEQPVGSFKNAAFVADGSRARQDLYFQPGAAALRAGEANRLRRVSRRAAPDAPDRHPRARRHDRLAAARRPPARGAPRVDAADAGAGAAGRRGQRRWAPTCSPTPPRSRWCSTTALVIECPGNPAADYELTTPLPQRRLLQRQEPRLHGRSCPRPDRPRASSTAPRAVTSVAAVAAPPRGQGHHDPARHHHGELKHGAAPQPPRAA